MAMLGGPQAAEAYGAAASVHVLSLCVDLSALPAAARLPRLAELTVALDAVDASVVYRTLFGSPVSAVGDAAAEEAAGAGLIALIDKYVGLHLDGGLVGLGDEGESALAIKRARRVPSVHLSPVRSRPPVVGRHCWAVPGRWSLRRRDFGQRLFSFFFFFFFLFVSYDG